MHVVFEKSPIAGKKMRATFYSDKTMQDKIKHTDFGAQGYRDYTLMSDKDNVHYIPDLQERLKIKSLYQMRHRNDNIRDPTTAGALSFFVLCCIVFSGLSVSRIFFPAIGLFSTATCIFIENFCR